MLESDPIVLFRKLFAEAAPRESFDAARAALATCDADGAPCVRFVLVKGAEEGHFVTYTNLNSPKARELARNPRAALAFHWHSTGVQVRVSGEVEAVEAAEADAYFASRPRGSQLGAWASPQSDVLENREWLEARVGQVTKRFEGQEVPRPDFWSGFRLLPNRVEFWYNRDDRLHDRFVYEQVDGGWHRNWLAP